MLGGELQTVRLSGKPARFREPNRFQNVTYSLRSRLSLLRAAPSPLIRVQCFV